MRAKIQGQVWLEVVIQKDGTVGDVKVVKSLDRSTASTRKRSRPRSAWLFQPAT